MSEQPSTAPDTETVEETTTTETTEVSSPGAGTDTEVVETTTTETTESTDEHAIAELPNAGQGQPPAKNVDEPGDTGAVNHLPDETQEVASGPTAAPREGGA